MPTAQDFRNLNLDILTRWVESRQLLLQSMLCMAGMTVEREIEMRDQQTKDLQRLFSYNHSISTLREAINHVEVILRRLPEGSEQLPRYLDSLSYMRVSEYEITQSASALDQAVKLSLRAKDEAQRFELDIQDPEFFLKVLNDLGYAQSHRYGELGHTQDLEAAIQTGRSYLSKAGKERKEYNMGVLNLASRLRIRYQRHQRLEDYEETTKLLKSLMDGSLPHNDEVLKAYVNVHLSELSYIKFSTDKTLQDLDEAIRYSTAAIDELEAQDPKTEMVLARLCEMHGDRYDRKKQLVDVEKAVNFSRMRVLIIPPTRPLRGAALHKHIFYSTFLAKRLSTPVELDELADSITELMDTMPEKYEKHELCCWLFGDILACRYEVSGAFSALTSFLDNSNKMCSLHNERVHAQGEADVSDHKIIWLQDKLRKIINAPEDNPIRRLTLRELPSYFRTACETNGVPNAAITLWNQQGQRLSLYADTIEANEHLDEDKLEQRLCEKLAKSKTAELAEQHRRRKNPWKTEEYKTEFGLRSLDIDPATGMMIFDLPTIVQDIFGYETTHSLPLDAFVERELRLEAETRQKELSEGRFPNPKLCRVCRKLQIIEPDDVGAKYRWKAKVQFVPFGNFNQLLLRRSCTICRLVLGLISTREGRLHGRLAAIDDEVQGTALERVTLEDGEDMLKVSYGLREVGSLKILGARRSLEHAGETENVTDDGMASRTLPIARLKRFMNDCDHNHGLTCNTPSLEGKLADHIPMYQIDVIDQCLISTTSAVKYFALSYVWGSVDMSKTLLCNLDARLQPNGLDIYSLPHTIRDAFSFVKGLGERYLWVDALCIVQDDLKRKQQDIQHMDLVYSRAFATLVALTGRDADAGLPGVRAGTWRPTSMGKLRVTDRSKDLAFDPNSSALEEVCVTATPMSLSLALEASKWDSRGWTLQERFLSKRCVFFSDDTVYFQCQRHIYNEDGRVESGRGLSMTRIHNPLTLLPGLEKWKGEAAIRETFKIYKSLVEKYTLRDLTFGGDVMNAFAGVWAVLQPHTMGRNICGIPAGFLDLGLLWTPAGTMKRREDAVPADITPAHGTHMFPSWSWAGYVGAVEFRLLHDDERPLPKPMIEQYRIFHGEWVYTAFIQSKREKTNEVDKVEQVSHADQAVVQGLKVHGALTLQFEAFVVPVSTFTLGSNPERLSFQDHVHATSRQNVYRLFDQNGKHCGIVFDMLPLHEADMSIPLSFVGIVKYGETRGPYLGPKRVEGNITLFDDAVFPATGSGSGLVDALLVGWTKSGVAERRSVARIHAQAWDKVGPVKQAVALD